MIDIKSFEIIFEDLKFTIQHGQFKSQKIKIQHLKFLIREFKNILAEANQEDEKNPDVDALMFKMIDWCEETIKEL